MTKRRLWPAVLFLSCAGPPPATTPAPGPAPGARSAADDCLAEAAAPRTPRAGAPDRITVSHVLVRHRDLKRPEGATRSRGEACLRAREAREKLLGGADFTEVVGKYSDGGDATGGKLGTVARADLDETFANAAFALDVGELSHVVESPRGFHVIARTQ